MKTRQLTTNHSQRDARQHALRRGLGFWELTFEGRQAVFKQELGALCFWNQHTNGAGLETGARGRCMRASPGEAAASPGEAL